MSELPQPTVRNVQDADIVIRNARVHNLQNVSLTLPRGKLICFTGVSGSGKSSLAFDTLYAEGQRRYVESLPSYARQFLNTPEKPDVDHITGLSPSISIEQKAAWDNPRSTVGTVTQIYDFLRVLFCRLGTQHCPKCGRAISAQTRDQMVDRLLALPAGTVVVLMANLVKGQKGEHRDLLADLRRQGYSRGRLNGQWIGLADNLRIDRLLKNTLDVVIDRVQVSPNARPRLTELLDEGLKLGRGTVIAALMGVPTNVPTGDVRSAVLGTPTEELLLSSQYACAACGVGYEPPSPQLLSFNSPLGMCLSCNGLGLTEDFDPDKIVADASLSFEKGCLHTHPPTMSKESKRRYEAVARGLWFSLKTPWRELPPEKRQKFLFGAKNLPVPIPSKNAWGLRELTKNWVGLIGELRGTLKAVGDLRRRSLERYLSKRPCVDCGGSRLNPQARAVRLVGRLTPDPKEPPRSLSIADVCALSVQDARCFVANLELTPLQHRIGGDAVREVVTRLGFLVNVGLEYLTLSRATPTLSGGEAQRIRLAAQVGCGLTGVLYVLDEPSIGLHPRDNTKLIESLKLLRDLGNTVIVVEHDEETMRAADLIVDFGPGPGVKGGHITFAGGWDTLVAAQGSLTADYLTGRKQIELPAQRRPVTPFGSTVKSAADSSAAKSSEANR